MFFPKMIFSEETFSKDTVRIQNRDIQSHNVIVPEFSDSVLDTAFQITKKITVMDNDSKKQFHVTIFFIHPSGFVIVSPHNFPIKVVRITEPPFTGTSGHVVSRLAQHGFMLVKFDLLEQIPLVPFGSSMLLKPNSCVFSISNLYGNGLYLRQGFRGCRQPISLDHINVDNALVLDILVDDGAIGSPVLDQQGKIIAVIVEFISNTRLPLAMAIPTEEFLPVFKKTANTVTLYGIKLDMETQEVVDKDELIVSSIDEHSELAKLDVKVGDKITKLGEWEIKCDTDFWLSQLAWCMEHYNEPVPITFTRQDIETPFTVKVPWTEEKLQGESNPPENLKRGCYITVTKKDTEDILFSGRTESLTVPGMTPNTKCELTGFLKIYREGTYAFHLGVPGTGTLKIGEQFVIEKDKKHPKMRVTGRGFFTQGLYRFSLTLDINETVTEPFIMVETPLDFIESNLPSPLSDDWIFCEDK
jgi:S1-C subfamily serine protease